MNTDIKKTNNKKQTMFAFTFESKTLPHDQYSVTVNHEGSSTMRKTASCSIPGREKEINFYITIVHSELSVKDKPFL